MPPRISLGYEEQENFSLQDKGNQVNQNLLQRQNYFSR
jgi:hypothetical protein